MDPIKIFGSKEKAEEAYKLLPPVMQGEDKDNTLTNLFLAFIVAEQGVSAAEANAADQMEPEKVTALGKQFFTALGNHTKDQAWYQKIFEDSAKKAQAEKTPLSCLQVLASFDIFEALGGEYKVIKEDKKAEKKAEKKEDKKAEKKAEKKDVKKEEPKIEEPVQPAGNRIQNEINKAGKAVEDHVRNIQDDAVRKQYAATFLGDCVMNMKSELEGFEARMIKSQKNPDANFGNGKEGSSNYQTFCKKLDEKLGVLADPKSNINQIEAAYADLKKDCATFLKNTKPFDSLNKAERQAFIAATNLQDRIDNNLKILDAGRKMVGFAFSNVHNPMADRNLAGVMTVETIRETSRQMEKIIVADNDQEKNKLIERGKQEFALLQDRFNRYTLLMDMEKSRGDKDINLGEDMNARTTVKDFAEDYLRNKYNDMLLDKTARYGFDDMVDLSIKTKPEFLKIEAKELSENPVFKSLVEQVLNNNKAVGKVGMISSKWRMVTQSEKMMQNAAMKQSLAYADFDTMNANISDMKSKKNDPEVDGINPGYNKLADMVMTQMLADPKHQMIRQAISAQISNDAKKLFGEQVKDPFANLDKLVTKSPLANQMWTEVYSKLESMKILDKPQADISKMVMDGSLHQKIEKSLGKSGRQEVKQSFTKQKESKFAL